MDDGSPTRPRRRVTLALAFALLAAIVFASCSGGDDGSDVARTTTTAKAATTIDIPLGYVSADSAGPQAMVSTDQAQRVLDALTTYVKGAVEQPLRSGKPTTADLSGVFDPATLASATTADRGVVLDEGLPKVTGDLTITAEPVALVGLGDQSGNVVLISAALVMDAKGATTVKGGPLHVVRRADLVLQPDFSGTWKITAYDMTVLREGAGLSPSTTTTSTGAAR